MDAQRTAGLPVPQVVVWPETEPYWNAARAGRLVLPRCTDCGTILWYPKSVCTACMSSAIEWIEASGTGLVYSYTIVHHGFGAYAAAGPYCVALIELDEGPRIFTNIIDSPLDGIRVGDRASVVFDDRPPDADRAAWTPLPRFRVTP